MKKIALIISEKNKGLPIAQKVAETAEKLGCVLYIDEKDKSVFENVGNAVFKTENGIFSEAECAVVLGGDGTIVRTAHRTNLPILGINLGRIGYMAELEPDELHLLRELVAGNYSVENRMMIDCVVTGAGKEALRIPPVLNEVVLSRGGYSEMTETDVVCNGEEVGKYFADGLICATPTGSTAYSLAAGGSIVDPGMTCFCVSPICPQSFYAKPLIFDGSSVLEFRKGKKGRGRVQLICDGDRVTEITDGDVVTVQKSGSVTRLIKIKKNNFYSVMRSKMTEI